MSEQYDESVKQKAVAEVTLGLASMTQVAARYGMSISYLSILCTKSQKALKSRKRGRKKGCSEDLKESSEKSQIERIVVLEQKVRALFHLLNA